MLRPASRSIRTLALSLLLVAGVATPAYGWANGGGNGYGTHDWIVGQAIKVFDGSPPSWFDLNAALAATDDPDQDFYASNEHVFYEQGYGRGAVDRIAKYYHEALVAHAGGDDRKASIRFGWLAHYYGDILQPFHTNHAALDRKASHKAYELLVDKATGTSTMAPSWMTGDRSPRALDDVRTTAIAAAAYSRKFYAELYREFHADESRLNGRVSEITGSLLKRASSDLAAVLYSIDRGVGDAATVGSVSASVKYTYAAQNAKQPVYVTVKDAGGGPLEGVRVDIDFPKPTGGTTLLRRYTDANGTVTAWGDVGASPFGVKRDVKVTVTTNDVTRTATPWFMATRKLASGTAGFKTWVKDSTVKVGQTVKIISRTRDTSGRPVAKLKVTWTWTFNDGSVKKTVGTTNSKGKARTTMLITSGTPKGTVKITARTQSARVHRTSYTSFRRY
ncbi:MAG: hypothetical protein H0T59_04005 [Chloroflexi bacterium]|nr:hypothetical protein [Chloroflexota bacterium]